MALTFVIFLMVASIQKPGVIMDKDVDQRSLHEAVDRMTEFRTGLTANTGSTAEEPSVVWIPLNSTSASEAARAVCRALNVGMTAVISALRCPQRRVVSAMTETFQIPHLSVDLDLCPSRTPEEFTIHLSTMYQNIGMLLVDITRAAGCKEVALITDDISEQRVRQSVIVQLSLTGVRTVLVSVNPRRVTEWSAVLKHIIIITRSHQLKTTLQREANFTWRRGYRVWAYTTDLTDSQLIRQLLKPYNNINIVLMIPGFDLVSARGCLPCLQSGKILTILEILFSEAMHRLHRAYNFIANTSLLNHHEPFCSVGQPIPFAGGVQLLKNLKSISNDEQCNMGDDQTTPAEFLLFALGAGFDRRQTWAGQWSKRTRLTLHNTPTINRLFAKEADFNGITLRVAVSGESYPYVGRIGPENGSYQGVTIDMLNDLATRLNFRYVLVESKDGYGVNPGNGSWSGMVGMAARGEVDLVASPMTVTPERSKVVDFTAPFLQEGLGILTPRPNETADLFQLFKPFALQVWLSLLGIFLFAVVMTMCILVTTRSSRNSTCRDGSEKQSVQDNILLLISAFCQQGPTFHPTSVSARCFLSFWFIFTILAMTMYTANLAAVLTVSTPLRPINSLQDLVDQTEFGIMVDRRTSIWDLFKLSEQPLYKQIGERMEAISMQSTAVLSTIVKDGRYCFIDDRTYLEFVVARACGQIRLADERFGTYSLAFALPKGSPHKHAIDVKIQKMVESGLIVRWIKNRFYPSANCSLSKMTEDPIRLGLDRIGGVVVLYLGFAVTAVLVLLVQRAYNMYKQSKRNFT